VIATPRALYIHDDLTPLSATTPETARLARLLLDLVRRDGRVHLLTLDAQVEAVAAQGPHAPFAVGVGIAAAGEAVARALHARTGWFPAIHRIEVTREETSGDGYDLVTPRRPAPTRSACAPSAPASAHCERSVR